MVKLGFVIHWEEKMKILHTSDLHLGHQLYGKKRSEEFSALLEWLLETIQQRQVDALLVSGDVFDTTTPSHLYQSQYYHFLFHAAVKLNCQVIVTAGNHDSPSFLDAPQALLRSMNIHVVGSLPGETAHEVVGVHGASGEVELLVCAVPFLRDRDIRQSFAGESPEDKERNLVQGIADHYARVFDIVEQKRTEIGRNVPVVAMGHLFAAGGSTLEDDGVRELYVGTLGRVPASVFPEWLEYVALGHLHFPQVVGGRENVRYSGSPLAMGFSEAHQRKSVCLVDFSRSPAALELLPVPCFQPLHRLRGNLPHLREQLHNLVAKGEKAWVEIVYDPGSEANLVDRLRERLEPVEDSPVEILRIKNPQVVHQMLGSEQPQEELEDLDVEEVFQLRMEAEPVPEEQRVELLDAFHETLLSLQGEVEE